MEAQVKRALAVCTKRRAALFLENQDLIEQAQQVRELLLEGRTAEALQILTPPSTKLKPGRVDSIQTERGSLL